MRILSIIAILTILSVGIQTKHLYSGMDGSVVPLSRSNWSNQVVKGRTNDEVIIVHFFKSGDGQSYDFGLNFSKQADKTKGIFKWAGIDCGVDSAICNKEGVTTFPTVKIYPPIPIPPFVPEEAGLDAKKIAAWASGYVPNNVKRVTDDNMNGILNSNPSVPKVLLLSNKDKIPLLWKAISNSFKDKLFIGIAKSDQQDVVFKFNVKKFPSIVVQKTGMNKPAVYTGKINYQAIFDWLNIYSEQFVPGGGDDSEGDASKPWINESVPELFSKSADDVCFGGSKSLCVILFSSGKPNDGQISVMKEIRRAYDNKSDRSVSFQFMWLNTQTQAEWVSKFGITETPTIVVLNTGRRKRFLRQPGSPTSDSLNGQLEKILGGDSRFTPLRPNEVPKLV